VVLVMKVVRPFDNSVKSHRATQKNNLTVRFMFSIPKWIRLERESLLKFCGHLSFKFGRSVAEN